MNKMIETPHIPERCYEYKLTSKRQLEYRILLGNPADEAPPGGYAVIYALDGDALFQTLAEAVKLQTRKPKGFDPILVVGIGYPSREPFDVERRCRDFTMHVDEASLPERPDGRPWPPHGEADHFLDFLEFELMPAIAKEWPIDPNRQLLVGHSLGGLFALHALFTRPQLFTHYVAGSPSVWWANNEVLKEMQKFKAGWQGEYQRQLLLTIGADELEDMLEGAEEVAAGMATLAEQGLHLEWIKFTGEDHVTVLPAMLSRLPRFVWSGKEPK
ncbi:MULTISPECIES: alpha/beta hydrolase [Brevibacillus]|uniref:alpha/beta hydrolase n=1 Tax=Brevibacillus TaxID=55080 RepID=UPI00156B142E|nr:MULTISPECIES: alpha/beta hydrolase-fold protein [Brevibacillus]UED69086.1 prolyl oligopeptidase family serine peptidase [Brevibacillus sp. HD3.3A]WDV95377.1 alpha/beta hydrolase-fold protein [Brevibacillus parabrevis]